MTLQGHIILQRFIEAFVVSTNHHVQHQHSQLECERFDVHDQQAHLVVMHKQFLVDRINNQHGLGWPGGGGKLFKTKDEKLILRNSRMEIKVRHMEVMDMLSREVVQLSVAFNRGQGDPHPLSHS